MGHIATPDELRVSLGVRFGCLAGLGICWAVGRSQRLCCMPWWLCTSHTTPLASRRVAAQQRYGVDEVRYVDELAAVLAELAPPCLHVLDGGVNTDRCGV